MKTKQDWADSSDLSGYLPSSFIKFKWVPPTLKWDFYMEIKTKQMRQIEVGTPHLEMRFLHENEK